MLEVGWTLALNDSATHKSQKGSAFLHFTCSVFHGVSIVQRLSYSLDVREGAEEV